MKIVVLGDSYTYGQGCSDRFENFDPLDDGPSNYCWASLMQQQFNCAVENRARSGWSNAAIIESLHQNITTDIDLIICCLSFPNRIQIKYTEHVSESINQNWKSAQTDKQLDAAVQQYYKHLYSHRVGYINTLTTLLSAYGVAKLIGAKFLWSKPNEIEDPLPVSDTAYDLLNEQKFLASCDFKHTADELAPCRHPNNKGHLRYFEEIIAPSINNKIIGTQ